MVHCRTVHLPLGALLIWCAMCGTGDQLLKGAALNAVQIAELLLEK